MRNVNYVNLFWQTVQYVSTLQFPCEEYFHSHMHIRFHPCLLDGTCVFQYDPHCQEDVATTTLSAPAKAGETILHVESQAAFAVGDRIIVNEGAKTEEENEIVAFGSIKSMTPLKFDHDAGETLSKLPKASFHSSSRPVRDSNGLLSFVGHVSPCNTH